MKKTDAKVKKPGFKESHGLFGQVLDEVMTEYDIAGDALMTMAGMHKGNIYAF